MYKIHFRYFNGSLSQGYVSLFSGRMLQHLGYSLIGLFLPIYLLLAFGYKVEYVFYYYLAGHLVYAVVLPAAVRFLNKIGLRRSLRASIFFFAAYYTALFLLNDNVVLYTILSLVFLTIGRTLFWLPYHTDLAKFTNKNDRGKSISLLWATTLFVGVIMPVVAGYLIESFGYTMVFILAIAIYLSSFIPFLTLPKTNEHYSWGFWQTFREFFSSRNKKLVLSNMANGAENAVSIIIWPIFIWQLLNGSYLAVGAISSLIVLVTIFLELAVGKYTDVLDKRKMIHWGSMLYAFGWLAKTFVFSAYSIFVVGTYHQFAQIFKDTPFDTLNYELLADCGHYVDEYTVLKEIAVQLGKVIILVLALVVALNFGLNWTFILAAIASLFINLL